jgi:pilus assembly protein Flp/PilA
MVRLFKSKMVAFLREEDGPTASEYAVMLALVITVLFTVINALGSKVNANFAQASQGW